MRALLSADEGTGAHSETRSALNLCEQLKIRCNGYGAVGGEENLSAHSAAEQTKQCCTAIADPVPTYILERLTSQLKSW